MNNLLVFPVNPMYIATSIVRHCCTVKMPRFQVMVLLQIMFQSMVAGQVYENVTLPSIQDSSLAETNDSRVLPSGYVGFSEIGFAYKVSDEKLTYNEARKKCLNEDGQLAVIDSREKVEKILNHFTSGDYLSVGLVRFFDAEEWITIDGKSTNNLPWTTGEPSGDFNCVYLSRALRALANENCGASNRYLCEIALPTE